MTDYPVNPHTVAEWLQRVCKAEQERGGNERLGVYNPEYLAALKAAEEALQRVRRYW